MQKALILKGGRAKDELDKLLDEGWTVVHTCPMPSSGGLIDPTCLVILESDPDWQAEVY